MKKTSSQDQIFAKLQTAREFVRQNLPYLSPFTKLLRVHITPNTKIAGISENAVLALNDKIIEYCNEIAQEFQVDADKVFVAIYVHEILHFACKHWERSKAFPNFTHRQKNVAMDLSVNSVICEIFPDLYLYIQERLYYPTQFDLPTGRDFEFYIQNLPTQLDFQDKSDWGNGEEGSGVVGTSADWEKELPPEMNAAKSEIEEAFSEAAKIAQSKGWGTVPQELKILFERYLQPSKIDWRFLLYQSTLSVTYIPKYVTEDFRRLMRPYEIFPQLGFTPVILPREFYLHVPNLCILIDTSGSMVESRLRKVLSEIVEILKLFGNVYYTCADVELKFEPKEVKNVNDIDLIGGGGTVLFPCIKEIDEKFNFDLLLVFTDMEWDLRPIESYKFQNLTKLIICCIGNNPVEISHPDVDVVVVEE